MEIKHLGGRGNKKPAGNVVPSGLEQEGKGRATYSFS
jgi:hypothetical protein